MSNFNPPRRGLLDGMADIVSDLWGTPAVPQRPEEKAAPAEDPAVHSVKPNLPPFSQLWKTADESIDWTEALASPVPTDGLTDPDMWALYHAQAEKVLSGDTAAYLTVLKAANPMADLMPFVTLLDVSTQSADRLSAAFAVREDLLEKNAKEYLAGMALRIARDLFAVLPVTAVAVTGKKDDDVLLTVSFERNEMNRVRFAFIDPIEFVVNCGGEFPQT